MDQPEAIIKGNTLWLFNVAMENNPFTDDFHIETSMYNGYSMAMLNNQMVFKTFPAAPPRRIFSGS